MSSIRNGSELQENRRKFSRIESQPERENRIDTADRTMKICGVMPVLNGNMA